MSGTLQKQVAIGVDIGGTKIDFVLINEQGAILEEYRLPTDADQGAAAVLDRIAQGIEILRSRTDQVISGVGIGSPGHIDPVKGEVRRAINLGWHSSVAVVDGIRQRMTDPLPIAIQNDVSAAAIGEKYFGVAQDSSDFVYLAIGTGLGGAAVTGGDILMGGNTFAMEVGHLSLEPKGRLCGCGLRGCNEIYVSGVGLLAGVREHRPEFPNSTLPDEPSTSDILAAARSGDPLAAAVVDEAAFWLGRVMGSIAGLLNPSLYVIGGGLGMAAADLLLEKAEQTLRQLVLPESYENISIRLSAIQRIAVGSACLALKRE